MEDLFRNTLSPGQWALLGAVPPAIIALYFLKLRRMPVEVPSTYLWSKSIEDLRVNSLWQRLRQSLLLLLQLLVVLLAIFALLRPGWQGTDLEGQRLIFLIDNSASMSTKDASVEEGDSNRARLEAAKKKVAGLVDQMERGMTAMIISFAGTPRVVQEFTDNTRLLRERLDTIKPSAEPTDLRGALKLAEGLANPAQVTVQEGAPEVDVVEPVSATLFILSDGRFSDVEDFALGNLDPVYVPLGSAKTANLAITAFDTRRSEASPTERSAFVQVSNFSETAASAVIEIRLDNLLLDAQRLTIGAGDSSGLIFPLGEAPGGALEARIGAETVSKVEDRLAIDNQAYAALNDGNTGKVLLVSTRNPAIEQALATGRVDRLGRIEVISPAELETDKHQRLAAAGAYDLIIYDRCQPEAMPRAHTAFLGVLPPTGWLKEDQPEKTVELPQVIDWNRAHPLMSHVELGNFWIFDTLVVRPPIGGATLVDASEGPIMAIAPRDGFEDLVLGFPVLIEEGGSLQRNTNWINRHSFPTFWLNALEYFLGQSAGQQRTYRPGNAVELKPVNPASEQIEIAKPDGQKLKVRRRGQEPFVFQETKKPGIYRVFEAGTETERFAINLFDRSESNVRLQLQTPEDNQQAEVAAVRIGNIDVAATVGAAPARKELWKILLLAALALLVLEWYVYHRRVYV